MDILLLMTLLTLGLALDPGWIRRFVDGPRQAGPELDNGRSPDSLRDAARLLRPRVLSRVIDRYVAYLRGRERLLRRLPAGETIRVVVERDIARARRGLSCYLDESRRRGLGSEV